MELACDIPDSGISDELIQLFLQLSHFVSLFNFVFSVFNVQISISLHLISIGIKYSTYLFLCNLIFFLAWIFSVWSLFGWKSWWIEIYHLLLPWCFSWSSLGGKTWKGKQNKGLFLEKFSIQNWSWGGDSSQIIRCCCFCFFFSFLNPNLHFPSFLSSSDHPSKL